jgi:hypothetical protein
VQPIRALEMSTAAVATAGKALAVGAVSAHMVGLASAKLDAQIGSRYEATSDSIEYASEASFAGAEVVPSGELRGDARLAAGRWIDSIRTRAETANLAMV